MNNRTINAAGALSFLLVPVAFGAELTLNAGAELEWTDNVYSSSTEKQDDLLETVLVGAQVADSDSAYDYAVNYELSHERYQQDSYDPENYYTGNAFLLWLPLPGRFDWRFEVDSEVTRQQATGPDTPDNRDQRTEYSTSPRLILLSRPRDTVSLQADATKITLREDDGNDSDRIGGTLAWQHAISQLTSLNLSGNHEKVNFQDAPDYERDSYSLGFTRQINGGSISLSGGQTRLTPDEQEELEGTNAALNVTWSSAAHTFSFDATRDLSDTSAGFSDWSGDSFFTPTDINTGEIELITYTTVSLSNNYAFNSTTNFFVMLYADDEESESGVTDIERQGVVLSAIRNVQTDLDVRFDVNFERTEDLSTGTEFTRIEEDTTEYRLSLNKRFDDRVAVSGWLRREDADSDVDTLNYEVHAIGVSAYIEF